MRGSEGSIDVEKKECKYKNKTRVKINAEVCEEVRAVRLRRNCTFSSHIIVHMSDIFVICNLITSELSAIWNGLWLWRFLRIPYTPRAISFLVI